MRRSPPSPAWPSARPALFALLTFAPRTARAGEVQFGVAFGGQGILLGRRRIGVRGIRAGYRFRDLIAPYFLARAGYATVNQRVLEAHPARRPDLGPASASRAVPAPRHDPPARGVVGRLQGDVFNSFLGVGDGIRHRFGGEFALGPRRPVKQ